MTEPTPDYQEAALQLAKGEYQRGLVLGYYRLSGAKLRGKAKEYSYRYRRSREALFDRMREANIPFYVHQGKHGKLTLRFGEPPPEKAAAWRLGAKDTGLVSSYLGVSFW